MLLLRGARRGQSRSRHTHAATCGPPPRNPRPPARTHAHTRTRSPVAAHSPRERTAGRGSRPWLRLAVRWRPPRLGRGAGAGAGAGSATHARVRHHGAVPSRRWRCWIGRCLFARLGWHAACCRKWAKDPRHKNMRSAVGPTQFRGTDLGSGDPGRRGEGDAAAFSRCPVPRGAHDPRCRSAAPKEPVFPQRADALWRCGCVQAFRGNRRHGCFWMSNQTTNRRLLRVHARSNFPVAAERHRVGGGVDYSLEVPPAARLGSSTFFCHGCAGGKCGRSSVFSCAPAALQPCRRLYQFLALSVAFDK